MWAWKRADDASRWLTAETGSLVARSPVLRLCRHDNSSAEELPRSRRSSFSVVLLTTGGIKSARGFMESPTTRRGMKKRGRCLLVVTLIGTTLLGVFVVTRRSPNLERWHQIHVGMDLADVKRLFPNKAANFTFDMNERRVGYRWWLDDMVITVFLDDEHRVVQKARDEYAEEPLHCTVSRWIGMNQTQRTTAPRTPRIAAAKVNRRSAA